MKKIILLTLLLGFSGCQFLDLIDVGSKHNYEHTTILKINDVDTYKGLTVTFLDVLDDSRCPINAYCVWAGNAEMKFAFSTQTDSGNFYLNTGMEFQRDTTIGNINIKLMQLFPYPYGDSLITKDKYITTLKMIETK